MNPYEVLGVSENASEEEIKRAYKELVKKYQKQLWYYARALERVWKKTVKEAYLYSFGAGKALPVDVQK